MVRALHGRWRDPLLPHLYRFQPPGFLSVPWREDWRLPGTQGPTRSLRPPLLGASGLSLGINSLDLEGWGREGEALLRCLQKQETTKPIPETTSAPRVEIQVPPSPRWVQPSCQRRPLPSQAGAPGLPPLPSLNHLPALLGPKSPLKRGFLSKLTMACSLLVFLVPKLLRATRAGNGSFLIITPFPVPTAVFG